MKRVVGALLIITFLNGCSLPLIGSFTSSGITGVATGNYQKSLVSSTIDLAVHKSTGKTVGQNLYAMVENKYVAKVLDNMNSVEINEAVKLIAKRAKIEVSGSINLERAGELSGCGIDTISAGALTHSAPAADISMNIPF